MFDIMVILRVEKVDLKTEDFGTVKTCFNRWFFFIQFQCKMAYITPF